MVRSSALFMRYHTELPWSNTIKGCYISRNFSMWLLSPKDSNVSWIIYKIDICKERKKSRRKGDATLVYHIKVPKLLFPSPFSPSLPWKLTKPLITKYNPLPKFKSRIFSNFQWTSHSFIIYYSFSIFHLSPSIIFSTFYRDYFSLHSIFFHNQFKKSRLRAQFHHP